MNPMYAGLAGAGARFVMGTHTGDGLFAAAALAGGTAIVWYIAGAKPAAGFAVGFVIASKLV